MAKKKRAAENIHDRDRIIVRLPDGMRDKLAAVAEANGRSMTAEVVAVLARHLQGPDRVTQLWETHQRHLEDIEGRVALIWEAVENLEDQAAGGWKGEFRGGLKAWLEESKKNKLREAAQSLTTDQAREEK